MQAPLVLVVGTAVLLASSCQPTTNQQMVYDYSLTVTEMHGTGGPEVSLEVDMRYGKRTSDAYASLYEYSRFYTVLAKSENEFPQSRLVPQDTLRLSLSRAQTDSIYQLARQAFALPQNPALRPAASEPPFPVHDLDTYLTVRFSPYSYWGPSMSCSGYRENNAASYRLQEYLMHLKNRLHKKSNE